MRRDTVKKRALLLVLALGAALLLCACRGHPLPDGLEESALLETGRAVVAQLNEGDWQGVYDRMRADGRESTSPEDIQTYIQAVLDKAGAYVREDDSLTTGQTLEGTGEEYGTAVFYCKHEKKDVSYRIAFSTDLELMGFEVKAR